MTVSDARLEGVVLRGQRVRAEAAVRMAVRQHGIANGLDQLPEAALECFVVVHGFFLRRDEVRCLKQDRPKAIGCSRGRVCVPADKACANS